MHFYKPCANKLPTLQSNEANEDIRSIQSDRDAYFTWLLLCCDCSFPSTFIHLPQWGQPFRANNYCVGQVGEKILFGINMALQN